MATHRTIGRFRITFTSGAVTIQSPPGITWADATENERIEFDAWVTAQLGG